MNVGERIRQLRIHKKLTQGELVKGISSITYLSRIENEQIKPSHSFLEKISKRLKIPLSDLVENNLSDKENRVSTIFHRSKEKQPISEEEISFLSISAKEAHSTNVLKQIYGMLIRHFLPRDMEQAEKLYTLSSRVIPHDDDSIDLDPQSTLSYYISCGIYFYKKQLYDKADDYFTEAERIMDHHGSIENGKLYYNLSLVKQQILEDKTLALHYSKKSYNIFAKHNLQKMMSIVLITQGVQYHLMEKFDQSLICIQDAEALIQDSDEKLFAMIEYNKGRVYQGLERFDEAINYYERNIIINEKINRREENIYSLRSLGEIFIQKKLWDQAEASLSKAFVIAEEFNMHYMFVEIGWMRAYTYKIRGDDFTYEKSMTKMIEHGVKLKQPRLVKQMAKEFGNFLYDVRAYKKAADYYKLAIDHDI